MFLLAEDSFIPMLFPPEIDTMSADAVKDDLKTKLKSTLAKMLLENIPQAICQFYLISVLRKIGCSDKSVSAIYFSVILSVLLAINSVIGAYLNYLKYKTTAAKMFVNKHLKSKEASRSIAVDSLTHEDFVTMA